MFIWDDKALDALGQRYLKGRHDSILACVTADAAIWGKKYAAFETAPLVRVQDKLQLECRATVLRQGRGPVQGLRLQCFGHTGKGNTRVLREENVLPDTSINDQRRIMDAMCNIIAVQEGCDYKLVKPHKVVVPVKLILRPERGRR